MINCEMIKGVIHINVMLQNDSNTTYLDSEIMPDNINLDYKILNKYAMLSPHTLHPYSLQSESDSTPDSFCSVNRQRLSDVNAMRLNISENPF